MYKYICIQNSNCYLQVQNKEVDQMKINPKVVRNRAVMDWRGYVNTIYKVDFEQIQQKNVTENNHSK